MNVNVTGTAGAAGVVGSYPGGAGGAGGAGGYAYGKNAGGYRLNNAYVNGGAGGAGGAGGKGKGSGGVYTTNGGAGGAGGNGGAAKALVDSAAPYGFTYSSAKAFATGGAGGAGGKGGLGEANGAGGVPGPAARRAHWPMTPTSRPLTFTPRRAEALAARGTEPG